MRAKRWELNLYSFYDHTGMERHLEKMAEKGWMIERLGGCWRYRRMEPRTLRFCVAYYPDASEFDPIEPSEGEQTFWEYCAGAGWVKAANRAQMQVFYNEDETAVPIETEAAVQVETLHRAAKKGFLSSRWVLIVLALFQMGMNAVRLRGNLTDALSNLGMLSFFLDYLLLLLLCGADLISYYRWRRKAKRAAEELGRFTPTHSYPFYQAAILAIVLLFALLVLLNSRADWRVYLFAIACMLVLNAAVSGMKEVMRRRNVDAGTAQVMTFGGIVALCVVMLAVLTGGALDGWLDVPPKNAEAYEYTDSHRGVEETRTAYAYHDPLPLYVEDLTETDYDRYSCKRTVQSSPLVKKQSFSQETRWGDWGSAYSDVPELYYTIYDVKCSSLFAACLQNELYVENKTSFYEFRFAEVDPALWGADGAWREYDAMNGEEYNYWVLTYGQRIVCLNTRETAMDETNMALAGERLRSA